MTSVLPVLRSPAARRARSLAARALSLRLGPVALALLSVPLLPAAAFAATLQVGPGKTYGKVCDAIGAAAAGDTIEIDAGTYAGDTCYVKTDGLTIRGVGGRAKLDATNASIAGKKGILVLDAKNVTIESVEFTGASISDNDGANGAGIRMEGPSTNIVLRDCYFHDNQDGILAGSDDPTATLLIEYSEFDHNGLGNGCNVGGCTHNMYINHLAKFTLQYSYSHNAQTGHTVKTRAFENHILYNRIGSEGNGTTSYEIDMPNGGLSYVIGNTVQKDKDAGNGYLVAYAEEGPSNPVQQLYLVNNTFVSDKGSTFVSVPGSFDASGVLDNIFAGSGGALSAGTLPASNLTGKDPLFVNAAGYDYHLKAGSPAIDAGSDPGMGAGASLKPVDEYVQPLQRVTRKDDGTLDLGAFELGTDTSGAGGAGGSGAGGAGGGASGAPGAGGAAAGSGGTGGKAAAGAPGTAGSKAAGGGAGSPGSAGGAGGAPPGAGGSSAAGAGGTTSGVSDAPPADTSSSGGCAVARSWAPAPGGPLAALFAAAALLAGRRRRQR